MTIPLVENNTVQCACGRVVLETTGTPILAAACYCGDCRQGGQDLEALPGAPAVLTADGGTEFLLYRKDRMECTRGDDLLQDYRRKDNSPTRRVVAGCCNTALLLDFEKGHWYSMYRARFGEEAPPIAMRVNQPGQGFPFRFVFRVLGSRLAMLFGR